MIAPPRRIQLRRTKGWRKPEGAIVVARPSKWGNPYAVGSLITVSGYQADGAMFDCHQIPTTPAIAVALYRDLMHMRLDYSAASDDPEDQAYIAEWHAAVQSLRGRDLACWCPLVDEYGAPVPCHADVLLALANTEGAS